MTRELDTMHRESFPAVTRALDDLSANLAHLRSAANSTVRRSFLLGVGGVAVVGGLAACTKSGGATTTSDPNDSPDNGSAGPNAGGSTYSGEVKVVALSAAVENLAVMIYDGALKLAGQHRLGLVPPAVTTFLTTAMGQHKQHAAAWNAVLSHAKVPRMTGAPLTIAKPQLAALREATSVQKVAELALGLENTAAQTYTYATKSLHDLSTIMTAATIQPVEAMHAAILSLVLGENPVPAAYIDTADAVQPSALTT